MLIQTYANLLQNHFLSNIVHAIYDIIIVSRCQIPRFICSYSINLCLQYFGYFPYLHISKFLLMLTNCLGYSQNLHLLALFSRNFRYLYSSLSSSSMTRSSFLGLGTPMVLVASLCKENHWITNVTINTNHISVQHLNTENFQ